MVERRLLLPGGGVNHHEFVPAGHGPPVPEAVRPVDPGRRFGHPHREAVQTLADGGGAAVVVERALAHGGLRREESGPGQNGSGKH